MSEASTRPLVIHGAGGHGREILDIIDALDIRHRFKGFTDDSRLAGEMAERLSVRGTSVIGGTEWLAGSDVDFVIGIGTSAIRRMVSDRLADGSVASPTVLVHPSANIGSCVRLAPGVVLGANATVTTNVDIGRHTHINVGCAIQHDSRIGDFVTVSPGVFINGDVEIGDDTFIGTGAIITRGCTIGKGSTIGAGAVVLSDVVPGSRILGIPGRHRA